MRALGLLHEQITKKGKQLVFEIRSEIINTQPLKTQDRKTPLRENTSKVKSRTIHKNDYVLKKIF